MDINQFVVVLTPVLTGVVQAIKEAFFQSEGSKRFLPLIAILLGLVCGLGYGFYYRLDLVMFSTQGIIAGGLSVGLYETVKPVGRALYNPGH